MKILISAAETSADHHGAALLSALKRLLPPGETIDVFGVGGPALQAEGLRTVVDARELLAMGITEVLGRLPRIRRALTEVAAAAVAEKPDVAVVMDYPDFHFRLAARLKNAGIPMVYYIPPKVWVWRKRRVRFLRERFDRILCILPFEEEFYRRENVPVTYVGNPLVDELPLHIDREEARRKLSLRPEGRVLLLMPGSRPAELKSHLEPMLRAAELAAARINDPLTVLMPLPDTADRPAIEREVGALKPGPGLRVRISQGDSHLCMIAADAGLVKSGTSTLEAGILGCPHAVVYKPSRVTGWIFRNLVRYPGPVGLVNLVAGYEPGKPYLAREILCDDVTVEALACEAISLLTDEARRVTMREGFERLRMRVMGESSEPVSPSLQAAREVLEVARSGKASR